ncbi:hypothetical protein BG003_002195, partial [Podila horticola]
MGTSLTTSLRTAIDGLAATVLQQSQQQRQQLSRTQQAAPQEQEPALANLQPSIAVPQRQEPCNLPLQIEQQEREPVIPQHPAEPPPAPRIPTVLTWQEAVSQWENGDPSKGLLIPLRAWTKKMRKTDPTRYSQRKQIAKEFVYLGRNEGNMKDVHGKAADLIRTLLLSIRKKKHQRKHNVVVGTGTSGQQDGTEEVEDEGEDEEEDGEAEEEAEEADEEEVEEVEEEVEEVEEEEEEEEEELLRHRQL